MTAAQKKSLRNYNWRLMGRIANPCKDGFAYTMRFPVDEYNSDCEAFVCKTCYVKNPHRREEKNFVGKRSEFRCMCCNHMIEAD